MAIDKAKADCVLVNFDEDPGMHKAWTALLRRVMAFAPTGPTVERHLIEGTAAEWSDVVWAWNNSEHPMAWRDRSHDAWQSVVYEVFYSHYEEV